MKITEILLEAGTPVYHKVGVDFSDGLTTQVVDFMVNLVQREAPKAFNFFKENPRHIIWRGVVQRHGPWPDAQFQDTLASTRLSENTKNYVTMLTSILPSWRGWPPRSKGVSCSSSKAMASSYGQAFVALPCSGATVAYTGVDDFWNITPAGFPTVDGINESIDAWIYNIPILRPKLFRRTSIPTTPEHLIEFLTDLSGAIDHGGVEVYQEVNKTALGRRYLESDFDNLVDFIDMVVDPTTKGRLATDGNVLPPSPISQTHNGEEIFVSGRILYISAQLWTRILEAS